MEILNFIVDTIIYGLLGLAVGSFVLLLFKDENL
jgi:hypothetical protein